MTEKLIILTLIVVISMLICVSRENHKPTEQQETCDHKWHNLGRFDFNGMYIMYCPKCKMEKHITKLELKKMNIDKEYKRMNNNAE